MRRGGHGDPVAKDVPPYALVNRQRLAGVNETGMKRAGMTAADMADVRAAHGRLGLRGGAEGRFDDELRRFIEESKRGFHMPESAGSAEGGAAAESAG